MRILYIGGTGEISYSCLEAGIAAGQNVTVFNRGQSVLPDRVNRIIGDVNDETAYRALGHEHFDVVCQFRAFEPPHIERDLAVFGGRCGQYVFISSASAYEKPPRDYLITEATPLVNPFWAYSRAKAAMEAMLMEWHAAKKLPVTIIRPSHTYRLRFPGTFVSGDVQAWRILHGRPVIVIGDGTSLWTLTHSEDFARPFVKLLGNRRALGEAFHLTADHATTWDAIYAAIGAALGIEPTLVHVPTQTLIRYDREWIGPLLGDKSWSTVFDNRKVKSIAGDFTCSVTLEEGMKRAGAHYHERAEQMQLNEQTHALLDRIAMEQWRLGSGA